jgi:hypothetical protein
VAVTLSVYQQYLSPTKQARAHHHTPSRPTPLEVSITIILTIIIIIRWIFFDTVITFFMVHVIWLAGRVCGAVE